MDLSAGNGAIDACSTSPPLSAYVAAVGATVITDQVAEYSNTGKCVNVYAPGSDIYCANLDNGYQKISGTSMACPIVAGVIGQYLQYNNSLTTYDITDTIYRSRTRGNVVTASTGRPAPLIQIPTQYDLLLLNTSLVNMFNSYV